MKNNVHTAIVSRSLRCGGNLLVWVSVSISLFLVSLLQGCGGGTGGSSGGSPVLTRSIQGYIHSIDGSPLDNVEVSMANTSGEANSTESSPDGSFEMAAPSGDNYVITVAQREAPTSPSEITYSAKLNSESKIRAVFSLEGKVVTSTALSEASVALRGCNAYILVGQDIVKGTGNTENDTCQAEISYVSETSSIQGFGLYGSCNGGEETRIAFAPLIGATSTITLKTPFSTTPGCALTKIEEIGDTGLKQIQFSISG